MRTSFYANAHAHTQVLLLLLISEQRFGAGDRMHRRQVITQPSQSLLLTPDLAQAHRSSLSAPK